MFQSFEKCQKKYIPLLRILKMIHNYCNVFAEENSAKNSGEYNPWPGFKFTGALRPQRVVS